MNPLDDRLTILERAQLLHDATLQRHGAMLDRHEEQLIAHAFAMGELRRIQESQERLMETLAGISGQLTTTAQAIKDLLERGNGR